MSGYARAGWRDVDIRDEPSVPLPSGGGGNGQTYVRNKQLATGFTWISSTDSLLEVRFAWSTTQAGKNPPALGADSALSAYGIPGLPVDPRVAGGLPSQVIGGGYADLGRQQTNPQWQYPKRVQPEGELHLARQPSLAQERLRVPVRPDRSSRRESPLRARHLRGRLGRLHQARRRATSASTTSPTSCLACAASTP